MTIKHRVWIEFGKPENADDAKEIVVKANRMLQRLNDGEPPPQLLDWDDRWKLFTYGDSMDYFELPDFGLWLSLDQASEVAVKAARHAKRMAAWPIKKVPDLKTYGEPVLDSRVQIDGDAERLAFYAACDEYQNKTGHEPTAYDVWLIARGLMGTDGKGGDEP